MNEKSRWLRFPATVLLFVAATTLLTVHDKPVVRVVAALVCIVVLTGMAVAVFRLLTKR